MQENRGKSRILHRRGKHRLKEGKSLLRIPLLIRIRAGICRDFPSQYQVSFHCFIFLFNWMVLVSTGEHCSWAVLVHGSFLTTRWINWDFSKASSFLGTTSVKFINKEAWGSVWRNQRRREGRATSSQIGLGEGLAQTQGMQEIRKRKNGTNPSAILVSRVSSSLFCVCVVCIEMFEAGMLDLDVSPRIWICVSLISTCPRWTDKGKLRVTSSLQWLPPQKAVS